MTVYSSSTYSNLDFALNATITIFHKHYREGTSFSVTARYGDKELELEFNTEKNEPNPLILIIRRETPQKAAEIEARLQAAGIFPNIVLPRQPREG